MNGLDDLRGAIEVKRFLCQFLLTETGLGWTLGGAIQSSIDVYLSQDTFIEVQRSFPYLVSKEFASGGGDVRLSVSHSAISIRKLRC